MSRAAVGGVIALFGLVFVVAGLVLGYVPVHVSGVSCGSAFNPSDDAAYVRDLTHAMAGMGVSTDVTDACDSARSNWNMVAILLLVLGGLVLVVGAVVSSIRGPQQRSDVRTPGA
ncbi:hypothetical protein [Nocardioides sp. KR10-350]|uniref:hypothetical protein n=1 Tax=Nocardioides cheoyonin TaxID=3156615 RepID=UPI0032B5E186